MLKQYEALPNNKDVLEAIEALKANGIEAELVENRSAAKDRVFQLIPKDADVMTMTSTTLDTLGIADEINNSGRFQPTRSKFEQVSSREKKMMGAAPGSNVSKLLVVNREVQPGRIHLIFVNEALGF